MNLFTITISGIKQSLQDVRYKLLFVGVSFFVFFLFVLIPTVSVPGNDFFYQLSLFSPLDFSVTIFLSILYALFVTMQIYAMRHKGKIRDIGTTVGGGVGAIFAGVAGTAFCASCLAPLFALFDFAFGGTEWSRWCGELPPSVERDMKLEVTTARGAWKVNFENGFCSGAEILTFARTFFEKQSRSD